MRKSIASGRWMRDPDFLLHSNDTPPSVAVAWEATAEKFGAMACEAAARGDEAEAGKWAEVAAQWAWQSRVLRAVSNGIPFREACEAVLAGEELPAEARARYVDAKAAAARLGVRER